MSTSYELEVPPHFLDAAARAAEQLGKDIADVSITVIARAAGVSRSTLVRRLGGSRRALDDAVRRAGMDPGGRRPLRERAIEAGARLLSDRGLARVTLEEVAQAADCSVPSLYATFGTRDKLLAAIYERHSPIRELMKLFADPAAAFEQTVADVHGTMAIALSSEPRVAPAMLADLAGNPYGPMSRVFARYFPQALSSIGGWLRVQVRAGRIRDIPLSILTAQLIGPLTAHLLLREGVVRQGGWELPDLEEACSALTRAFVRAVAAPQGPTRAGASR